MLNSNTIILAVEASRQAFLKNIDVFQEIDSTNNYLLNQPIDVGVANLCVAEAQSSGRGRRGNDWQSASNHNIMMSLSWGFTHWPETITGLGLAVSLMVAERLNYDYQLAVKIKWPNDLMVDDDKLGGILIDLRGEASGECKLVIGVGLNVHQPDWSSEGARYKWTDLNSLGVKVDRNQLIGKLCSDLIIMLQEFECSGFKLFVERWGELSSHTNRRVKITGSNISVEGIMRGVDENGALLIESFDGEIHVFTDSNVSLSLL